MTTILERAQPGHGYAAAWPSAGSGEAGAGPRYAKRRMHHIFAADGRALVVAMDGARHGPAKGLHDPVRAVRLVVEGGADAILTTYGMARATADVLRGRGLIIGLDSEDAIADYGVEHALRFGADALQAGARGIVFGRNIVTADRPDRMCAALGEIIHGGATVDAAARQLSTQF